MSRTVQSLLHVLIHSPKTGCRIIKTIRLLWKLSINNWITPDLCTRCLCSKATILQRKAPTDTLLSEGFCPVLTLWLHRPYLKNHISRDPLWPLTLGAPHGPYNGASNGYQEIQWTVMTTGLCLYAGCVWLVNRNSSSFYSKIYNELSNCTRRERLLRTYVCIVYVLAVM